MVWASAARCLNGLFIGLLNFSNSYPPWSLTCLSIFLIHDPKTIQKWIKITSNKLPKLRPTGTKIEVRKHLEASLKRPGASWGCLGRLGGVLGAPGTSWARLGCVWTASWELLGGAWGVLGVSWKRLGGVLEGSWKALGRSWAEKCGQHGSNLAFKMRPR